MNTHGLVGKPTNNPNGRPRRPLEWTHDGSCIRCTNRALNGLGYPLLRINGAHKAIARWILIKRLGEIPSETVTRHTCDNRWCINPNHIIHGSQGDNIRDAFARNRMPTRKGVPHPHR